MTLAPSFAEQQVLAATRRRDSARMSMRTLFAELLMGVSFVVAVAVLWAVQPPRNIEVPAALMCVAVLIIASRVRFDTPFGFTVPTQLAFVPMLFAIPLSLVPVAFAISLLPPRLADVIAGRKRVHALLQILGNSWSAVFPCAVFIAAGIAPRHAGPFLLLAALAAQFAGDFAVSAAYFGAVSGARLSSQLRDSWVYLIDAALSGVALVVAEEIHTAPYAVLGLLPLLGLLAMFAHERQGRLTSLLELNETYHGTALLLGDVIAADDGYTGEHSQGVVGLAMAVGTELGLDVERRRNLEFGALLHDVGKICVPKEIINKPGKLEPHEWEIIKTHAAEGERMLNQVGGFMRDVGRIVRSHHERWDGGGYPDGLAAEAIPLESRIIACCDSWNAMRTDRSYRKALPFEVALQELHVNIGRQFDATVVDAVLRVVTQLEGAASPELPVAEPVTAAAPRQTVRA